MPSQRFEHRRLQTSAGVLTVPVLDKEATSKLCLTWHWSASSYSVVKLHREHYHFILGADGRAHHGVPIERNVSTRTHARQPGYAAHVKNANSNNIGIAAAAMGDAREADARHGRYGTWPVTAGQVAGLVEVAAQLCHF